MEGRFSTPPPQPEKERKGIQKDASNYTQTPETAIKIAFSTAPSAPRKYTRSQYNIISHWH